MVGPGTFRFQRPITVIYADPDRTARRRIADDLESVASGLAVDPVGTPTELREALADADERTCVVTEYRLGRTDALSLYEDVCSETESGLEIGGEDTAPVPFVLYTADGDELLASDAIAAGLDGYVPKRRDDSIDRLLEQLRRTVERRGACREAAGEPRSGRAVQNERDRFRSLFENIPDPVVLTVRSDDKRILDVNPAFEDVFGYERDAIVGTSIAERIVPDGSKPVDVYGENGVDGSVTTVVERLTADGLREFLIRVFAIEFDDEVHEYAIYTDIAEQKRRERELERYRTLVETVGDSMYVLDADGKIEMVNDAMADRLSESRANLVGAYPSDYMSPDDVERGTETLLEILEDDDRRWGTFEMRFEPVDGEPYMAEDNVAPLVEDGELAGSVGVIRDIADRKERERRIRRLHDGTRRLMAAEVPKRSPASRARSPATPSSYRSTPSTSTTRPTTRSSPSPSPTEPRRCSATFPRSNATADSPGTPTRPARRSPTATCATIRT